MIGFSPPEWFEVGELKMACFTITDDPGGQYVYTNRNREWVEDYLSKLPHGGVYYSHPCGGSPSTIAGNPPTFEDIIDWWLGKSEWGARVFPLDAGCCVTFSGTDRRAYFMFYGYDRTPEREWIANPIADALSYGRVPHKPRKQRKLEYKDPTLRKEYPIRGRIVNEAVEKCIPPYIRGVSLYQARCFEK